MATKQIAWNTGSGNITVDYGGVGDGTITISSDSNSLYEVRSQQITVRTTDGSNIEKTITIQQAARVRVDISTAVVTAADQTYSGSAKTPAPTVALNGDTIPSTGYDVTYSNNTNAGTATITVTGKGDYMGTASGTFTIAKATPTVVAPTPNVLEYTGSAQALCSAGNTDFGTLKYRIGTSGTWSTSVPTATDHTTNGYDVYYMVEGNSNVNDMPAAGPVTCNISEKPVTATVTLSQTEYTYNGSACTPSVTVKDGSTIIPASEYTVTYSNNTNAGTATVTISDNAGGNYEVIGSATFTIAKASISPYIIMSGWTYGGIASDPSVSGNPGGGSVTYSYKVSGAPDSSYTSTKPSNAGDYVVRAIVAETSNYLGATVTNTFAIDQREVALTWGDTSWTYDKSAHSTTCTAGNLITGDICTVTLTGNSITNKGTTTVTASSLSNSNYKLPSANTTTLTVNARVVTLSWGTLSWTYDGSAHSTTCTAGNLCSGDTCTVTLTGNSITNAGSATVTASSLSNSNYALPSSKTATLSVSAKTVTLNWGTDSWTYDKSSHSTTCTASGLVGSDTCTVTLTGNSVGPNVGSATVTASSLSNSNYTLPSANTKVISITAKVVSLSWGTTSWVYDAAAHSTTCTAGSLVSGDTCTVILTGNSITSKGTATVTASSLSNSNYTLPSGKTATLTITARPINVTASSASKTYDGTALTSNSATAEAAGTNRGLVSGHSMTSCTVTGTITNAGSASNVPSAAVIKTSGGTEVTSNYDITYVNGTLAVAKAAGSVSISGVSSSYSGSSQSLASVSGATGTMHYSTDYSNWSTSIPVSTNAGSWTIYWYMDASTNYEGISASTSRYVSSSIAKINPTITAAPTNANPTYNGSTQYLLTGGTANVGGNFSYSTGTNAGSYTATWWFTPNDTTNYNSLSGYVAATIAKASRTLSFTDSYVVLNTSSNTTKTATPSAGSGDGSITYSISSTTYATINSSSGKVTSKTSDGSAVVTATIAEGTNYLSATASYNLYVFATTHNYDYNGSYRSVTLPPGTYQFQCWGAQGGSNAAASSYGITAQAGGKGGYAVGQLTVAQETSVRVYVGGQGSSSSGGFNGGGSTSGASSYSTGTSGQDGYQFGISEMGGGGGATDIRLSDGALLSRMIVAGGGSGGAMCYMKQTTSTTVWTTVASGSSGSQQGSSGYYYKRAISNCAVDTSKTYRVKATRTASKGSTHVCRVYYMNGGSVKGLVDLTYGSYKTLSFPADTTTINIESFDTTNQEPDDFSVIVQRQDSSSSTDTYTDSHVGWYGGGVTGGAYRDRERATQTSGGGEGGSFGNGANQTATNYMYAAGAGGGGWYGGSTTKSNASMYGVQCSAGGSGWVNTSASAGNRPSGYTGLQLDSGSTTAGNSSFPAPSGGNETGHSGNGYARITRL